MEKELMKSLCGFTAVQARVTRARTKSWTNWAENECAGDEKSHSKKIHTTWKWEIASNVKVWTAGMEIFCWVPRTPLFIIFYLIRSLLNYANIKYQTWTEIGIPYAAFHDTDSLWLACAVKLAVFAGRVRAYVLVPYHCLSSEGCGCPSLRVCA